MESICNCMMNVHRKGHHQFVTHLLIFAPCYHRGKEFPLIKNMNIKVFISYPWQTGNIEEIQRLIIQNSAVIFISFSVGYNSAIEL